MLVSLSGISLVKAPPLLNTSSPNTGPEQYIDISPRPIGYKFLILKSLTVFFSFFSFSCKTFNERSCRTEGSNRSLSCTALRGQHVVILINKFTTAMLTLTSLSFIVFAVIVKSTLSWFDYNTKPMAQHEYVRAHRSWPLFSPIMSSCCYYIQCISVYLVACRTIFLSGISLSEVLQIQILMVEFIMEEQYYHQSIL